MANKLSQHGSVEIFLIVLFLCIAINAVAYGSYLSFSKTNTRLDKIQAELNELKLQIEKETNDGK